MISFCVGGFTLNLLAWHNFMFYALVELGAILMVKLNGIFLRQTLCAGPFVLYANVLVKLTPEEYNCR